MHKKFSVSAWYSLKKINAFSKDSNKFLILAQKIGKECLLGDGGGIPICSFVPSPPTIDLPLPCVSRNSSSKTKETKMLVQDKNLLLWSTEVNSLIFSFPSCILSFLGPKCGHSPTYNKTRNRKSHISCHGTQNGSPRELGNTHDENEGRAWESKDWVFMCFWAPLQVALMSLTLGSKLQTFRIKLQYRSLSRSQPGHQAAYTPDNCKEYPSFGKWK